MRNSLIRAGYRRWGDGCAANDVNVFRHVVLVELNYQSHTKEAKRASHRFAWLLAHGEWPSVVVCHSCDVKHCVNPSHLWLGTVLDNTRDAAQKGLMPTGDRHGRHTHPERTARKLTDDQMCAIRDAFAGGAAKKALARQYGVAPHTIRRVVRDMAPPYGMPARSCWSAPGLVLNAPESR